MILIDITTLLITGFITLVALYYISRSILLNRRIKFLKLDNLTNWEKLVKARELIISVDVENELNIDQLALWNEFINNYYSKLNSGKIKYND